MDQKLFYRTACLHGNSPTSIKLTVLPSAYDIKKPGLEVERKKDITNKLKDTGNKQIDRENPVLSNLLSKQSPVIESVNEGSIPMLKKSEYIDDSDSKGRSPKLELQEEFKLQPTTFQKGTILKTEIHELEDEQIEKYSDDFDECEKGSSEKVGKENITQAVTMGTDADTKTVKEKSRCSINEKETHITDKNAGSAVENATVERSLSPGKNKNETVLEDYRKINDNGEDDLRTTLSEKSSNNKESSSYSRPTINKAIEESQEDDAFSMNKNGSKEGNHIIAKSVSRRPLVFIYLFQL